MLSALILLIMTFLPMAWGVMLYCQGEFIAASAGVMLFVGSCFFVYCFLRLLRRKNVSNFQQLSLYNFRWCRKKTN